MTNPFAPQAQQPEQPQQQAPAAPQQPAANPFGQPAGGNPFGQQVPQQVPAPAAPQAYAPQQGYPQQQAYAPPAAPGYAPQQQAPTGPAFYGAQQAPQGYAPQQAAPAAPATPPPALNPQGLNSAPPPPPSGDAKGAKLAHMYGRLVLVFPHGVTSRPRKPEYITPEQRAQGNLNQDVMTATVVVLDDGRGGQTPITYGGNPAAFPPVPDTESAPLPYVRKAMWITQSRLIAQLTPYLPQGAGAAPGMVAGRVVKAGPQANDPWYLDGANDGDLRLAQMYLEAVAAGHLPHPLA